MFMNYNVPNIIHEHVNVVNMEHNIGRKEWFNIEYYKNV